MFWIVENISPYHCWYKRLFWPHTLFFSDAHKWGYKPWFLWFVNKNIRNNINNFKTINYSVRSNPRLSLDVSYLRTGFKGCSKIRRVLAKPRLILDEMCRLYGKFASYLRRVLCKTRHIFPRINGPIVGHSVQVDLNEPQLLSKLPFRIFRGEFPL